MEPLSARNLARFGMRRGAYNGANGRRFVLYYKDDKREWAVEYDTKRERDNKALELLAIGSEWHDKK